MSGLGSIGSIASFGAPLLIKLLTWWGFTEDQARDMLKRSSDSQARPEGPNTQTQLQGADADIEAQHQKDLEDAKISKEPRP